MAVLLVVADHLVAAVLQDLVAEVMEDINPDDVIDMCVTKDGLALMYKSVCFHLDKWAGGHPHAQEALVQMKDNLLRIMLEQQFKKP